MSEAARTHPGADMERFVKEQMAFVGLSAADAALESRRTATLVLTHEAALTATLYEHFLAFPSTARSSSRRTASPDRD